MDILSESENPNNRSLQVQKKHNEDNNEEDSNLDNAPVLSQRTDVRERTNKHAYEGLIVDVKHSSMFVKISVVLSFLSFVGSSVSFGYILLAPFVISTVKVRGGTLQVTGAMLLNTAAPSASPSSAPSAAPSASPSSAPSASPSASPSAAPSASPSVAPSKTPSASPSAAPSTVPSAAPSTAPSAAPTGAPSAVPSNFHSSHPSATPSVEPSSPPTASPSATPTVQPTNAPSLLPSYVPSNFPSSKPSDAPSYVPSSQPSKYPSASPTHTPSSSPTNNPSASHSAAPTTSTKPSHSPTSFPTSTPSAQPTPSPTASPTASPSSAPSYTPKIFYVMGDVPYTAQESVKLQRQLREIPGDAQFVVHVGDLQQASKRNCTENTYSVVKNILLQSPAPLFIIPGDNDVHDCHNPEESWVYWQKHFSSFENNWQHSLSVSRQSKRKENFAFIIDDLLFVGVNIVGGDGYSAIEWSTRLADDTEWIIQQIDKHRVNMMGLVIFGHAYPNSSHDAFFIPIAKEVKELGIPSVYIHGDGHVWEMKRRAFGADNMLRIQVDKGGIAAPLKVKFQRDDRYPFKSGFSRAGPTSPFEFDRRLPLASYRIGADEEDEGKKKKKKKKSN